MKLTAEEVKEPELAAEATQTETTTTTEPAPASDNVQSIPGESKMTPENTTPIDEGLFINDEKKPGKKGLLLVVVLIALAVALVSGGVMVYRRTMSGQPATEQNQLNPPEQPAATLSPQVTPVVELDRKELIIQVLNGSGTPGFAGKAQEYLEELGYEDVATGNASSYDYDETEIAIKEDKEEYLDMLKADLVEKYVVAAKTSTLDDESEYDAVITLGSDEAAAAVDEEEEATASPTPSVKTSKSPTPTPKATKSPTPTPED